MTDSTAITVSVTVAAPVGKTWHDFTAPEAIQVWNAASEDWHTTAATNDLQVGGVFTSRMEAKDGSAGFDFTGTYTEVVPYVVLAYEMADRRTVRVVFREGEDGTLVTETFDPETENPIEMQRVGWQAILDNFKIYCEQE